MSTNISKQKREDLIEKIAQIRTYIASAKQDENTGKLLTYLSELEKDVNGKKYGLVFEEHREEIDEVLDTHTPVLTEDTDMFIDNGGQMNFLIEGDNLASLKLLEKTMGLERSLTQAIRFVVSDLSSYLVITQRMKASIDKILSKGKFVVGEIDY